MDQPIADMTVATPVALSDQQLREAVACARTRGPSALTATFLPPPADPQRLTVLLTVLRADLGDPTSADVRGRLADYRAAFPILDVDPHAKLVVGSFLLPASNPLDADTPPPSAALRLTTPDVAVTPPPVTPPPGPSPLELTTEKAEKLGFTDLVQLGRGGFGSVYLAKQPDLGHRLVAIKYTALPSRESQVLAALHHPNIVPVLSVHEHDGARVFCMPYHGRHTLADVLFHIDRTKSLPATGAGFLSTAAAPADPSSVAHPVAARPVPAGDSLAADEDGEDQWGYYESDRQRLSRLSYVDSVVMGMTRLADALAHAHTRRVIHLDIKPANILITDDGVFMILDFGLADHNGLGPAGQTGGTIRYMAPEQLTQFVSGLVKPDVRMDLYALGVVFFELLTGRHPYAASMAADVPMHVRIAARHQLPPAVRPLNPAVPPAVEAIVLKLLQPDRTKRYQSAEHLVADLTRHQQHLDLKYAGNPSLWERATKFRRRHPVFAVALMALTLGLIALAAIGIAGKQAERAAELRAKTETAEAEDKADRLAAAMTGLRIDAGSLDRATTRAAALDRIADWRRQYAVDDDPAWAARPAFARLPAERQTEVALALAEQCLLAAHAERLNASGQKPEVANPALDRAAGWNGRAEPALAGRPVPPVVVEQRAEIAALRGTAAPPPPADPADESTLDLYLRGLARIADRDHAAAAVLERLIAVEPHHAAGQFALGAVYHSTGRFYDARERYQVAKALAKTDPRPAFNRGVLLLNDRWFKEAADEFTTALDRDPDLTEAYYYRALVRVNQGEYSRALDDVEQAIRLGGKTYRFLNLRHVVRLYANDPAGAERDKRELAGVPLKDEYDLITRGTYTHRNEPAAALADFRAATELNPLCADAWLKRAKAEADLMKPAEAAESLKTVVRLLPGQAQPKFDRAVLLARQRLRDEARRQIAGVKPETGMMWYQKACVHALGADTHLDDRAEAIVALRAAVQNGYVDFKAMEADDDLDNVRIMPEYQDLVRNKGRLAE